MSQQHIQKHRWRIILSPLSLGFGLVFISLWLLRAPSKVQGDLETDFLWIGTESSATSSVDWGDWDGDGDLDLAVGNLYEYSRVYENEGGILQLDPANGLGLQFGWDDIGSVAWGDWDGDGDLDLALGIGLLFSGHVAVLENEGGTLQIDSANGLGWSDGGFAGPTFSVAWGDWDGDGDLDLALGVLNDVNRVYENEGGTLQLDPANGLGWESTGIVSYTYSVDWGDWDGDGDLDLAVGNWNDLNQVYENEGDTLQLDTNNGLGWESTGVVSDTYSVDWGDWDGDGDLDLAVGNSGLNQVYENEGDTLQLDPNNGLGWVSTGVISYTRSVAWGDWDGDGDLDLAVGNSDLNQVYENEGDTLQLDPNNGLGWVSTGVISGTSSVDWGDWDGDGDLDLAVGNGGLNQVYENNTEPPRHKIYLPVLMHHVPAPLSCENIIINSSFESNSGWEIGQNQYPADYSTAVKHTGDRSMRIGIINPVENTYSYSSAWEWVQIPANITSATLNLHLYPVSGEAFLSIPDYWWVPNIHKQLLGHDAQYALVFDQYGEQHRLFFQRHNNQTWLFNQFDLMSFAGQTIQLYFGVYNDGLDGVTGMYVDDVSLQVCQP